MKDVVVERAYQAGQALQTGEVRPTPAAVLRRYRELKRWKICRKEYMFHLVKRCQPQRICDFGCGEGASAVELAALGYQVVGFDLSPDLIEKANRRAALDQVKDRATFMVANAAESAPPVEPFDLVFVEAVLHHMNPEEGLETILRLLKPGGFAVIQEPVAFSASLQWLKDRVPIEKDLSPNERPLNYADLKLMEEKFTIIERRFFHCFSRLCRLMPEWLPFHDFISIQLLWLDHLLINVLGVQRFAGVAVQLCQKRS